MTIDRWLRAIAGAFIMISLVLAVTVHQGWLYFTGFVGLNLFQSAFSKWCPAISLLRRAGVPEQLPARGKVRTT